MLKGLKQHLGCTEYNDPSPLTVDKRLWLQSHGHATLLRQLGIRRLVRTEWQCHHGLASGNGLVEAPKATVRPEIFSFSQGSKGQAQHQRHVIQLQSFCLWQPLPHEEVLWESLDSSPQEASEGRRVLRGSAGAAPASKTRPRQHPGRADRNKGPASRTSVTFAILLVWLHSDPNHGLGGQNTNEKAFACTNTALTSS